MDHGLWTGSARTAGLSSIARKATEEGRPSGRGGAPCRAKRMEGRASARPYGRPKAVPPGEGEPYAVRIRATSERDRDRSRER